MIPQEHAAAVTRALTAAFGVPGFDNIRDLTERPGSNKAFQIGVRGSAYLLRINTRPGDTTLHYHCMQAAADAGLAPQVRYISAEDRISIVDFIDTTPFPAAAALRLVPAALRALHGLPSFPASPFNTTCTFLLQKSSALDGFLRSFRETSQLSEQEREEIVAHYERVADAYSSLPPELVPSHNDLFKPDNILFDGSRVWLIDWEASFGNDRYADLAVTANMLVSNEAEESIFLEEYFGGPPTSLQVARLHLMQQLAHMFYAMAFLNVRPGNEQADWSEPVPTYAEYQRRFWAREVNLATGPSKLLYGQVHREQLQHNMREPKFREALSFVESQAR